MAREKSKETTGDWLAISLPFLTLSGSAAHRMVLASCRTLTDTFSGVLYQSPRLSPNLVTLAMKTAHQPETPDLFERMWEESSVCVTQGRGSSPIYKWQVFIAICQVPRKSEAEVLYYKLCIIGINPFLLLTYPKLSSQHFTCLSRLFYEFLLYSLSSTFL